MGLLPEIENRASVRSFTDEPLTEDQIARILEAGRLAPSAKNRQPWRFIVVEDQALRSSIRDASFGQEYVGEAPVIIAVCSTNIAYKMPNGQLSYPVDLSIAASFMMLQARHEGLGGCFVTTFRETEVKTLLTVPHRMRVVLLLAIGHPVEEAERSGRLPIERVSSRDHW